MKVKDTKEALNKAVNKISEAGKTAGRVLSETGKQIKDSQFVEKAGEGIKTAVQGAATGAEKVSEGIKTKAKKTKAAIHEKQQAKKPEHIIVKIKNSDITFLIPDEYQKLKDPSFLNKALNANHKYDCAYACGSPNSTNIIWVYAVDKKHPVLLDSAKDRIHEIHEQLGDDQGVIEVKEGTTASGCNFVYSIVKTIGDGQSSPIGSRYFLRLLIGKETDAIEINGSFEETGNTGMRDSMCSLFAQNAGLCSIEDGMLKGWSCDPYDPEYKHGIPMNLSEKEGLDGLFPNHPLSKAREFLLAVLNNELVIIKKENPTETEDERDEKEFICELFEDKCHRSRYSVDLTETKTKKEDANASASDRTHESFTEMLGLTKEQLIVLYSLEAILTKRDANDNPKSKNERFEWLDNWLKTLDDTVFDNSNLVLYDEETILDGIKTIQDKSLNKTWFYLVVLEAVVFNAYFPLSDDKQQIKALSKLKYHRDTDYIKKIVSESGLMDEKYVDRYISTYTKSYKKNSGNHTITGIFFAIVAVATIAAAIFAPQIAVFIFGTGFELSGAALTSACLAMAGGGAIVCGGLGMTGGIIAIAGGGALLGAATGGAATGLISIIAKAPDYTLSEAAKLEVVLREILLNAQHDTESAQAIIEKLSDQIKSLNTELENLKNAHEEDKEAIKNMSKSIDILKNAVKNMSVFKSSFECGLNEENK